MKPVRSWLLESVVAAIVIVACFGIHEALDFPQWALGFFAIPIAFYLMWRLQDEAFSWIIALIIGLLLASLLALQTLAIPESWRAYSSAAIVFTVVCIYSRLKRKRPRQTRSPKACAPLT